MTQMCHWLNNRNTHQNTPASGRQWRMTPGTHLTYANFFTWSLSHQSLQHAATTGQQEPHEKISHPITEHQGACECWWVWLGHNLSPPCKHHKWEEPGEENPNKTPRPQCCVSVGVTAKGLCEHRGKKKRHQHLSPTTHLVCSPQQTSPSPNPS